LLSDRNYKSKVNAVTDFASRRQRAATIAKQANLGAIAIVPGPNFSYLSGLDFHLMERPTVMFLTEQAKVIAIIPELERSKWLDTFPQATTFFWQDSDGYDNAFNACAKLLPAVIGVEGMRMRMFEFQSLSMHLSQSSIIDADPHLAALRICKDVQEIEALRKAIAISENAVSELLEGAKAGETELTLSSRLKQAMLLHGAEGFAFEPLVLSGPKSADPHGTTGERPIAAGEPLLIDFGASWGGMNADITRTFFCEYIPDETLAIYETVKLANERGRDIAACGITCDMLDRETTAILAASSYADMIVHKTGHGLGLDVHEAPQVMIGNHLALRSGMVITIEPGLYRSGQLGIRIEDDVLITEDGAESLTSFDREVHCFG
jgi:Xaa-Pro dipeptidase